MAKCVIVDDRLTGFIGMPSDPFVWTWFEHFDEIPSRPKPLPSLENMDRVVIGPEGVFSEADAVESIAVCDELVGLLDTYGVPFSAVLSEPIVYDSKETWRMKSVRRSVRFTPVDVTGQLQRSFVLLVELWLDLYGAAGSTVDADEVELHLMRLLTMEFMFSHAKHILVNLGWDEDRQFLVQQMFTPDWMLRGMPAAAYEARDSLIEQSGYRKLW